MRAALFVSVFLAGIASGDPAWAQAPSPSAGGGDPQGSANENPRTTQTNPGPQNNPTAEKAARDALPLTPEMIDELAKRFNASRRAEEQAMVEPGVPVNRRINVSFAPGAATSIISTMKGYPTAVSFFDSTGQPWPIQWNTNSNPAAVAGGTNCNVANGSGGPSVAAVGFYVCTPVQGSNVLEIAPISISPRGGLVVSLDGAPKPLAFVLLAGGGRYDASLSVHVGDRGPHARVDIMTRPDVPDTGAPFLTAMLQGVPPAEAVPLSVSGVSPDRLRAWRLGRKVYLRTSYTLMSPQWTASESEGGFTIYAVPDTPLVLLSDRGQTVSATLKE